MCGMAIKIKKRCMSLSEIHRRTGLSLAHVSKVYKGTRRPSIGAAELMAAAQHLTMDEFLLQLRAEVKQRKAA